MFVSIPGINRNRTSIQREGPDRKPCPMGLLDSDTDPDPDTERREANRSAEATQNL
jgi:hypothetical protein